MWGVASRHEEAAELRARSKVACAATGKEVFSGGLSPCVLHVKEGNVVLTVTYLQPGQNFGGANRARFMADRLSQRTPCRTRPSL